MKAYVFDLDGVLLDSRDAVKRAYAEVGVNMPDDAWGKPWHSWCQTDVHTAKVQVYDRMLRNGEVPTLPPVEIVREMLAAGERVWILTGASRAAVSRFIRLEVPGAITLGWAATAVHKRNCLSQLSESRPRPEVVYVDDDGAMRAYVPNLVSFIQYVGQSNDQLKEDIGWDCPTRSS